MSSSALPRVVKIHSIVSSRYPENLRPSDWERRVQGLDVVIVEGGERLNLQSSGEQSPPQVGWEILLTEAAGNNSFKWTLYGLGRATVDGVRADAAHLIN